jgi:hypothetical protein
MFQADDQDDQEPHESFMTEEDMGDDGMMFAEGTTDSTRLTAGDEEDMDMLDDDDQE